MLKERPRTIVTTLTNVGTAYPITVPRAATRLEIKCRTASALQMGFDDVECLTDWFTIPSGMSYYEGDLELGEDLVIYVAGATPGLVVETIVWLERGNK